MFKDYSVIFALKHEIFIKCSWTTTLLVDVLSFYHISHAGAYAYYFHNVWSHENHIHLYISLLSSIEISMMG